MAGAAFLCMIALSCNVAQAQIYNWTTIASVANTIGSADGTNSGALFNGPYGVALDGSGNVYVADYSANTIRKMTRVGTNWVSTTIAGSVTNFGSADGTNSAAQFNTADGIIQDAAGNLFVDSYTDNTIRKITPSGTNWVVSTIAGTAGIKGSQDGLGNIALFDNPYDVAINGSGNLYVTDSRGQTVRKITLSGTNWIVSTIAGSSGVVGSANGTNSSARFKYPTGVAVDGSGNVYVTDTYNDTIRKMAPVGTNWVVSTIGGQAGVTDAVSDDGTNSMSRFNLPRCLKVDGHGNVYVADFDHSTIRLGTPLIPYMLSTSVSGVNLLINGISGLAGGNYYVLASTNVALPFSQWTSVATNILSTTGIFTMTATNAVNPNVRQEFYILQLQ